MATTLLSCGRVSDNNSANKNQVSKSENLTYDSSKTAIIEFNRTSKWPFDSSFKAVNLTQDELRSIDSVLLISIADYNFSLGKDDKEWRIDLMKRSYRKQIIAVMNKYGQKEVWVNCFCDAWGSDDWKTKILTVDDGGNCYFNLRINLATKKYSDLMVNGVA